MVNEKRSQAPSKFCALCVECRDQDAAYRMFICLKCRPDAEISPICLDCMYKKHKKHNFQHLMSTAKSRTDVFSASIDCLFEETKGIVNRVSEQLIEMDTEVLPKMNPNEIDIVNSAIFVEWTFNTFHQSIKPYQLATQRMKNLSNNVYTFIQQNVTSLEGISWVILRKAGYLEKKREKMEKRRENEMTLNTTVTVVEECKIAIDQFNQSMETFKEVINRLCDESSKIGKQQFLLWDCGEMNLLEFHATIIALILDLSNIDIDTNFRGITTIE